MASPTAAPPEWVLPPPEASSWDPLEPLTTVDIPDSFLSLLHMSKKEAAALRPVFVAQVDRRTTSTFKPWVPRAVLVTQTGQVYLFDVTNGRITHEVSLKRLNAPAASGASVDDGAATGDKQRRVAQIYAEMPRENPNYYCLWVRMGVQEGEKLTAILRFACKDNGTPLRFIHTVLHFAPLPLTDLQKAAPPLPRRIPRHMWNPAKGASSQSKSGLRVMRAAVPEELARRRVTKVKAVMQRCEDSEATARAGLEAEEAEHRQQLAPPAVSGAIAPEVSLDEAPPVPDESSVAVTTDPVVAEEVPQDEVAAMSPRDVRNGVSESSEAPPAQATVVGSRGTSPSPKATSSGRNSARGTPTSRSSSASGSRVAAASSASETPSHARSQSASSDHSSRSDTRHSARRMSVASHETASAASIAVVRAPASDHHGDVDGDHVDRSHTLIYQEVAAHSSRSSEDSVMAWLDQPASRDGSRTPEQRERSPGRGPGDEVLAAAVSPPVSEYRERGSRTPRARSQSRGSSCAAGAVIARRPSAPPSPAGSRHGDDADPLDRILAGEPAAPTGAGGTHRSPSPPPPAPPLPLPLPPESAAVADRHADSPRASQQSSRSLSRPTPVVTPRDDPPVTHHTQTPTPTLIAPPVALQETQQSAPAPTWRSPGTTAAPPPAATQSASLPYQPPASPAVSPSSGGLLASRSPSPHQSHATGYGGDLAAVSSAPPESRPVDEVDLMDIDYLLGLNTANIVCIYPERRGGYELVGIPKTTALSSKGPLAKLAQLKRQWVESYRMNVGRRTSASQSAYVLRPTRPISITRSLSVDDSATPVALTDYKLPEVVASPRPMRCTEL